MRNFLILAISELVGNKPDMFYFQGDVKIENIVWQTDVRFSEKEIEAKIKELEAQAEIKEKYQAIETYIYSHYTAKKQAQDSVWIENFRTKLEAHGVKDLSKKIADFTTSFYNGKSLEEVLIGIDDSVKFMYEKLVKVAIKNEWAYEAIQEGKKAIAENREPNYPPFPAV